MATVQRAKPAEALRVWHAELSQNQFSLSGIWFRLKIYSFVATLPLRENITVHRTAKDTDEELTVSWRDGDMFYRLPLKSVGTYAAYFAALCVRYAFHGAEARSLKNISPSRPAPRISRTESPGLYGKVTQQHVLNHRAEEKDISLTENTCALSSAQVCFLHTPFSM